MRKTSSASFVPQSTENHTWLHSLTCLYLWKLTSYDTCFFLVLGTKNINEERPSETTQSSSQKSPPAEQKTPDPSLPSIPLASQPLSSISQSRQPTSTQSPSLNKPQSVAELALQAHISPQPQEDANVKKEEEPNMEHFAQAAENLVASLDDDDEVIIIVCYYH